MKMKKTYSKKLIVLTTLKVALWGIVAWLFVAAPLFVVNAPPDLLPRFAFLLFLIGLLLLLNTGAIFVRSTAPRFTWTVILVASSVIVLYNLSPLAPAWNCFGKPLYPATANAAGQARNNGWCIGTSTVNLSASDPQGFVVTTSGTINGSASTCPAGNSCFIALPEGSGPIRFVAVAATSGLSSDTGSTARKRDGHLPL